MTKYAVIAVSGKQYQVEEGKEVVVDRMVGEVGGKVKFDQVLLVRDGEGVAIGNPVLAGAVVAGKIEGQEKGEKVRVATYKAKTGYRRVKGFRAQVTRVKIEAIGWGEKKSRVKSG